MSSPSQKASLSGGSSRHLPAWAPLRIPLFRALWLASIASSLGSLMHEVGAAWLMTSLTRNPQMNAMVLTASTLPICLLVLPAGALADIVDRRKLVICTQSWLAAVTCVLAFLTVNKWMDAWALLFFTLLMALGAAMTGPAWQAIIPEIVKRRQVASAISLGSMGFNLSRVIGPALGGIIIAAGAHWLGTKGAPGLVFGLNCISYGAIVTVLVRWRRTPRSDTMPPEHVLAAITTGIRYTRHSPEMRAVLIRLGCFIICATSLSALLPLYARELLHVNAAGYGSLMGCFGLGALTGGICFARLTRRFTSHQVVFTAMTGVTLHLLVLALLPEHVGLALAPWVARFSMIPAGFCWSLSLLPLNVVVIRSVPDWVRSRAASMYLMTFFGFQTIGSLVWGAVAHLAGMPEAFVLSGAALCVMLVVLRRKPVIDPARANLEPSLHWPDPEIVLDSEPEAGPVMTTVEFEIDPDEADDFVLAMQEMRRIRLRDGALRWYIFQDLAQPRRWVETVLVGSWNEQLRQHARITVTDQNVESMAWSFHRGPQPPRVSHMLAGSLKPPVDDDN